MARFMDWLTLRFQGEGESRKATIEWDENTQRFFASVIAEAGARAAADVMRSYGTDPESHAEQHKAMAALIPWIEAQKMKAEKQAEFWSTLLRDNVKRGISYAFWLLVASAMFGLSGGLQWIAPLVKP